MAESERLRDLSNQRHLQILLSLAPKPLLIGSKEEKFYRHNQNFTSDIVQSCQESQMVSVSRSKEKAERFPKTGLKWGLKVFFVT